MTLNKNVGKAGDKVTVTGFVNRRGKKGDVMIYEPRIGGKVVGKDTWISDVRGYADGSRFVASGAKVGDVVAVTGTLYDYAGGKLAIENVTSVVVVSKVARDDLVRMFADIPADAIAAANDANHTVPKAIIAPNGEVKVFGKAKQVTAAIAALF